MKTVICHSCRALVYQKLDRWTEALSDAECAVSLDADMLKGHIILIKCQIKLELLLEAADTVDAVPAGLVKRPELMEQRVLAAGASKDVGNSFLRDGMFLNT